MRLQFKYLYTNTQKGIGVYFNFYKNKFIKNIKDGGNIMKIMKEVKHFSHSDLDGVVVS